MAALLCSFCNEHYGSQINQQQQNLAKIPERRRKKKNTFSTWTEKSPLKDGEINVTAKNKQSTCFSTTGCFCCREPRLTVHLLMFSKGIYSFTDLKSPTISFLVPWSINIKISPLMRPERNYLGKVVPSFVIEFKTIRDSKGVCAVSADEARRLPDDRCRVTFFFFSPFDFSSSIFSDSEASRDKQLSWSDTSDLCDRSESASFKVKPCSGLSAQCFKSNVMLVKTFKTKKTLYLF